MADAGSPPDKKFDSLVGQWNRMCGKGKVYGAACMRDVREAIEDTKASLAVQEKPDHWGDPAYPSGVPMAWPDFQRQILQPRLERLQKLLEHIAGGLPFP